MLLLFDIDGTLVAGATRAHSDALHAALHRGPRNRPAAGDVRTCRPAGRTDGEIARAILLDAGVVGAADRRAGRSTCASAAAAIYARICP